MGVQSDAHQICGCAGFAHHDVQLFAVRVELVVIVGLVASGWQPIKVEA